MGWLILAVAGIALVCPIMMFGPLLLQRLGLWKRGYPSTSCMGASAEETPDAIGSLHRRRTELDEEAALMRILADGAERRQERAMQHPPPALPERRRGR